MAVKLTTNPCYVCKEESVVEITREEYMAVAKGTPIQDALPDRDPGFRETLISGTHNDCFDSLFPPE